MVPQTLPGQFSLEQEQRKQQNLEPEMREVKGKILNTRADPPKQKHAFNAKTGSSLYVFTDECIHYIYMCILKLTCEIPSTV